jgi:hypothetical protein
LEVLDNIQNIQFILEISRIDSCGDECDLEITYEIAEYMFMKSEKGNSTIYAPLNCNDGLEELRAMCN